MSEPATKPSPAEDIRVTRPSLRRDLRAVPRGGRAAGPWIRIEDDRLGRFHRIGPSEYELLLRLDGTRTLNEARNLAAIEGSKQPLTPTQAESLVLWATVEGLLEGAAQSRATRNDTNRSSLMWIKLPLCSADADWSPLVRITGWMFSRLAIAAFALLMVAAMALVVLHRDRFLHDIVIVCRRDGWATLAIVWLVLKVVHEAGHLVSCRRYGGRVGEFGVAWMCLAPVAYVDLTDAHRIGSRWARIMIAFAGVYCELIVAAVAVLIWCQTTSPSLAHGLVSVALTAGVSSIAFNLNPLMRLDGYFALSDWLGRPNLSRDASQSLRAACGWLFFGKRPQHEITSLGMLAYGAGCFGYRIMVMIGLVTMAAAFYGRVGMMVVTTVIAAGLLPRALVELKSWTGQWSHRPASIVRAAIVCAVLAAIGTSGWQLRDHLNGGWAGVVEYVDEAPIRCVSAGKLVRVLVSENQLVAKGDPLAELVSAELTSQRIQAEFDLAIGESRWLRMRELHATSEAAAQQQANLATASRLETLRQREQRLTIRAPRQGRVVIDEIGNLAGRWYDEGDAFCYVADPLHKKVIIAAPQDSADRVAHWLTTSVQLRAGDGSWFQGRVSNVTQQAGLAPPHPAMAATVGGPLAVRADPSSKSALLLQPCLRLEAIVDDSDERLRPGQPLTLIGGNH